MSAWGERGSQAPGPAGGAGWGPVGEPGGSWAEGLLRLGLEAMQLPLRVMALGLGALTQVAQAASRLPGAGAAPSWDPPPLPPSGPAPPPAYPSFQPTGAASGGAAEIRSIGGAVRGGAACRSSENKSKEDRAMACSCSDQSLSGCDLKVVQYSIVTVGPYVPDIERIIIDGKSVATSEDMTDTDFTAFVLAREMRENPAKFAGVEARYLRVCYFVLCRLALTCEQYEKDTAQAERAQVLMLERINQTLKDIAAKDDKKQIEGSKKG